jgi:alginate O-acetyltransferase complex protein AlgI
MFGYGNYPLIDSYFYTQFLNNLLFFTAAIIACTPILKWMPKLIPQEIAGKKVTYVFDGIIRPFINVGTVFTCAAVLVGKTYNPFLYFRF